MFRNRLNPRRGGSGGHDFGGSSGLERRFRREVGWTRPTSAARRASMSVCAHARQLSPAEADRDEMQATALSPRSLRLPSRLLRAAPDERLVAALRRGDETAFEAIYDRHHRALLALLPTHAGLARGGRGRPPARVRLRAPPSLRRERARQSQALAVHDRPQPLPVDAAGAARDDRAGRRARTELRRPRARGRGRARRGPQGDARRHRPPARRPARGAGARRARRPLPAGDRGRPSTSGPTR